MLCARDVSPGESLRSRRIPTLKIALDVPAGVLETRIAARVDAMLAAGLVDEAERVGPRAVAADAIGYPQAFAFLARMDVAARVTCEP